MLSNASPLARILRQKHLLSSRLKHIGESESVLIEAGFVQPDCLIQEGRPPTLAFVDVVNIELTYRCNSNCPHCLQQGIRRFFPQTTELSTGAVEKAIREAWFCGFAQKGINLTGGEPLLYRSDLVHIIRYCHSLGLRIRLNTNTWWGRATDFRVDEKVFYAADDFIRFMGEIGLTMFAFSFDERVEYDADAAENLVGAIAACERVQFPYQIICTGLSDAYIRQAHARLVEQLGAPLRHMTPAIMDKIDIGGAANSLAPCAGAGSIDRLAATAGCRGKGFYRPGLLHIAPNGDVRTCVYGIGMANLGNVTRSTLMDIANRFPSNQVALAFQNDLLEQKAEQLFNPYAHKYRKIAHPCAACAVLASLIEACDSEDEPSEIERKNQAVGERLNLLKPEETDSI